MLQNTLLALLLASPLVDAQRFRFSHTGCLLDQSEQIADKIACGSGSAVAFAVEWYGADLEQLQSWLVVAGCSKEEARREAAWVSNRCQARSAPADSNSHSSELRGLRRKHRRSAPERIPLSKRDDDEEEDDDDDSNVAPTSTYNPYVITVDSSVLTCMTETSITTKVCSSTTAGNRHSTSCTSYPTVKPTCASGMSCAFDTDTGALGCYREDGVPVYGAIILGVIGLAVAFLIFAICATCCTERRRARGRRREAVESAALLASLAEEEEKRTPTAGAEVRARPGGLVHKAPASVGDAVPLMAPEYPQRAVDTDADGPFSDAAHGH